MNNIMEQELKKNFKELIEMSKTLDTRDIDLIEQTIDHNLKHESRESVMRNLTESFKVLNGFKIDTFFMYMKLPTLHKLDNSKNKTEEHLLQTMNKIKIKYGNILGSIFDASREPFIISGVESSVMHKQSSHRLKFVRADGKVLDGEFNTTSMLSILTTLSATLKVSMEKGVFNTDSHMIFNYLETSNELNAILKHIIENNKPESNRKND